MKKKFDVTGMSCSACSAHVEKSVRKLAGIKEVAVNLLANTMQVTYEEELISDQEICTAVVEAGYGATVREMLSNKQEKPSEKKQNITQIEISHMKFRLVVSLIFSLPLMYISMSHMFSLPLPVFFHGTENAITFAFTQFLLTLPILYVNRNYFIFGYKTLIKGAPNMDALIAIGSSAALLYGVFAIYYIGYGLGHQELGVVRQYVADLYFESAAMILTLITFGKFLEIKSKGKTSEAITKMLDLAPKTAVVLRNEQEREVPIEEVIVGDIVFVKPGQSIPVDGTVVMGSSFVDESALTGESIPVAKQKEDKVIAATMNKMGALKIIATKVGNDTTLAQIIQLVEEASSSKAPIAKLADQISGIFVPTVITISILATIGWLMAGATFDFALSIGIAVLVISCPCALGLATPVAIMVGTGKGAERGILIKSAESLETAHKVDTVVLDKTGTITQGRPKVTDVIFGSDINENELLQIAASLEKQSEHPLSIAIVEYAESQAITLLVVEEFQAVLGQGIQGKIGGTQFFAGNIKYMQENHVTIESFLEKGDALAGNGKTPLYFANDKVVLGIIAVADIVKSTSKAAIQQMMEQGIEVIMLTGDHQRTAEAIQKEVHISKIIAEVLPQDKENVIRKLQEQGKKVAMVGDGINDAPALVRADVGIAIGAGADIAMESADIVLMKSDLLDVVTALELSKAVIKNIKMNLFWAFFYNIIGIPLAAGVFYTFLGWKLNPMFGAAVMSMSSVCVVSNALRLKLFKPSRDQQKVEGQANFISLNQKEKEERKMKKIISIEGMMCNHCKKNVEKILGDLDGVVSVVVSLEGKSATLELSKDVSNELLTQTILDADYQVVSIK
ncbi:MAG: Lead, cadmium, zinc and mercury transporting ATPase [Massilibacillus sp.]|nr:Lead, cadmium, zinc and mercury transporting ATPase [Massilibacillus sp.]